MTRSFDPDFSEVFAVALTAFAFSNGDGWSATVDRDTLPLFFASLQDAASEYGVAYVSGKVDGWVSAEAESVTAGKAIRHVVKLACRVAGPRFVASGNSYAVALDC